MAGLLVAMSMSVGAVPPAQPAEAAGTRYLDVMFTDVTVTRNVPYASAPNLITGAPQALAVDIYQPAGDTTKNRAALIWVHGGGFLGGSKSQMSEYQVDYTLRGYVGIAVEYRLDAGSRCQDVQDGRISDPAQLAVERARCERAIAAAQNDTQAAVRAIRANAAALGVDPDRIGIVGFSAGAITAVNVGTNSDDPGTVGVDLAESSSVRAVIASSGCSYTPQVIDANDAPMFLSASEFDDLVPFACVQQTEAFANAVGASVTTQYFLEDSAHASELYRKHFAESLPKWVEFLFANVIPPVQPGSATGYQPLAPERIFDTRPAAADGLRVVAKQKIGGAVELRVKVTDIAGRVPATGIGAVSMNVTVTATAGNGFVTVYPCGTRPEASNLNYTAGATVPNQVIAPVSADGEVCFYSSADAHLLADINGYFGSGDGFAPVGPSRVFDTRPGAADGLRVVAKQKIGGAFELRVKVTDIVGFVPATGVGAVSLNLTVAGAEGSGYVTAYPCGTRPLASSVNYVAGVTVANALIAPVSPDGEICLYSLANTHLLADMNGYFSTGTGFFAVSPERIFDTRPAAADGPVVVEKKKIGGAVELRVQVTGLAVDREVIVPFEGARAVSLNVTVTAPTGPGFVTVYPCGTRPEASNLNYAAGQTVANAVIAPVGIDGEICLYSLADTHILADVNGYFTEATAAA
jgi:acetyl esterase/lipase